MPLRDVQGIFTSVNLRVVLIEQAYRSARLPDVQPLGKIGCSSDTTGEPASPAHLLARLAERPRK